MNAPVRPRTDVAVANLIRYLETGIAPEGLYAPDVFCDLSSPRWRLQAGTATDTLALRSTNHPFPGRIRIERIDETDTGFVMAFEERWRDAGQDWYCREMLRADVAGERIVQMAVYCTGDWDQARQREHAAAVRLIRE